MWYELENCHRSFEVVQWIGNQSSCIIDQNHVKPYALCGVSVPIHCGDWWHWSYVNKMILSTTASWSWIGWKLDAQQKLRKKSKGSKIHNRNSFSVMSGESTEPKTPLLLCGTPTQLIPYPQEQLCLPRLSSRKCVVYFHHLGVGFFQLG